MATLILGTVGRVFGGPIGGVIGTAFGSLVDSRIFGGGRGRQQGRISNPAIQSATYGEPIPIIVGRMRTAGNLIWTSGIREALATSGGGKRSGPTTTAYSYSASFAVGLVARRIARVGRIWADGKVIREAEGAFIRPIIMRLHDGDPDQPVDPLIAAAEGVDGTPAYRGLAYAVFEDLPLAEYGNRIPNLTFEIIADDAAINAGTAIAGLAAAAGYGVLPVPGAFPALTGHIAGKAGSLAELVAPLIGIADASVLIDTAGELAVMGSGQLPVPVPAGSVDAHRPGDDRRSERHRRSAADNVPGCLELTFYDTTRDYQPGLQRARRSATPIIDQRAISAAMSPVEAKALAVRLLSAGQAARSRQSLRLSWRHIGLVPGTLVTLAPASDVWRVREARFENYIVHLELERTQAVAPLSVAALVADGGRALVFDDQPAGPTTLLVLDLPALPGEPLIVPRLWIAGNGAGAGWRRAGVMVSMDDGASFNTIGMLEGGTVIGTTIDALGDAASDGWDATSSVEVELLTDRDWLEGLSADAVLAGGNLALVGDELVQFRAVDAVGPRRFRLHGLLRGRRGTEAETGAHQAGERFVLIQPGRMLALDLPLETLGRTGRAKPLGNNDADAESVSFAVTGGGLLPTSPANLRAVWQGGNLAVTWVHQSPTEFASSDFSEPPLGESVGSYAVTVTIDGRVVHKIIVTAPPFNYSEAQYSADGGGTTIEIGVVQLNGDLGRGARSSITVTSQFAQAI